MRWGWGLGAGGWILVATALAVPRASGLTEAPRLAAIYDSILGAQFDRVDAQLTAACPPAPAEACAALRAESVWWQIQIDPDSRALDARLETLAAAAINAAAAWTEREPKRAEAWFYLAAGYTPLVQLRALRHERMSAARAGTKIKDALEQALALDPGLAVAYNNLGFAYGRRGSLEDAERSFRTAGGELAVLVNMAIVYDERGDAETASRVRAEAKAKNPRVELEVPQ